MRGLFLRAAVLLVLGSGLGLGTSILRGASFAPAEAPTPTCEAPPALVEEIGPEIAADLCRTSHALIVDVRTRSAFEHGHIPNAIHLPCVEGNLEEAAAHLDRAELLLVYGANTEEAQPVASTLVARGWPAKVLRGGYEGWAEAGLACASGPCEGCEGRAQPQTEPQPPAPTEPERLSESSHDHAH
ncbi:MAG: rhodanese-like domain-containing protein [Deltaproteobacteria bacterium]|nr:rhodanese-like domain-containing protein [Deltaproteobacteria bacterium]